MYIKISNRFIHNSNANFVIIHKEEGKTVLNCQSVIMAVFYSLDNKINIFKTTTIITHFY
jgi:hypothetical protein